MMSTELGEFAMGWTLNQNFERDNPIRSLLEFNTAETIDDMHNALEYMLTGFNWVFADLNGDIGYQQSGFIANRTEGFGLIPKNGSAKNTFWNGLIPYEDQLFIVNPEAGFFSTANERVDDREQFYISEVYATRHRDDRIEQVIANGTNFNLDPNLLTLKDMQNLQLDVKTLVAEDLLDPVLQDFEEYKSETTNSLTLNIIDQLFDWDQKLTVESIEGLVFTTYRLFLAEVVFRDELGDLRDSYSGLRTLTDWYRDGIDSHWFDDIFTDEVTETSSDMAIKSLELTISYLSDRFGEDLNNWQWGEKHRVVLPHTFSGITDIFDIGGKPGAGSSFTVNAIAGPSWNDGEIDYISNYGPYFRMTTEVSSSWNRIYVSVTSGASGNPLSSHYDDAYEGWIANDYFLWNSDLNYIRQNFDQSTIIRST